MKGSVVGVRQAAQTVWLSARDGALVREQNLRRRDFEPARAEADPAPGAADIGSKTVRRGLDVKIQDLTLSLLTLSLLTLSLLACSQT